MAQLATSTRRSRVSRFGEPRRDRVPTTPLDRTASLLYFPMETRSVLTSFRKRVLTYIYRTALGLSVGKLESATVSLSSTPDEEDSFQLDLTLRFDGDWKAAQELMQDILGRVSEWSKEWPEEDQEDYGRWIYFGVIPAEL